MAVPGAGAAPGAPGEGTWGLLDTSAALATARSRPDVVRLLLVAGRRLAGASAAGVVLLPEPPPDGAAPAAVGALRWTDAAPAGPGTPVTGADRLPEVVAVRTGRVVAAVSPERVARDFPGLGAEGVGAAAAIPLRCHGDVVGALGLRWSGAAGPEAGLLLEALASMAGQALDRLAAEAERAVVLAEVRGARDRLAVLAEVGRVLAPTAPARPTADVTEEEGAEWAERAVGALAGVVVPTLADWSVLLLVDEAGRWRPSGAAHRDAGRTAEVVALARLLGSGPAPGPRVGESLAALRANVTDRVTDAEIDATLPDPRTAAAFRALRPGAGMVLPLVVRGRAVGTLTLVREPASGLFSAAEVDAATEVARRAGIAVDAAALFRAQKRLAEGLQRSLLTPPPRLPGLDVAVRYEPASRRAEVGGDWYDVLVQPSGSPLVVIGDVMGHDVEAAAGMGQLRGLLRGIAYTTDEPPDEVLRRTDEAMHGLGLGTTATAVVARLDELPGGGRRLVWSNAGHPPPVVLGADGTARIASGDHDLLLGVDHTSERTPQSLRLVRGDVLVLATDGLVERRDQDVDTGMARLVQVLSEQPPEVRRSAQRLCDAVLAGCAPAVREDDVALVAVRVR